MTLRKPPIRAWLLQFVAVTMLFGQLHVCSQTFHHQDGAVCTDRHEGAATASAHAPDHHHEHECELKPCHDPADERAFLANLSRDQAPEVALLPLDAPVIQVPIPAHDSPVVWLIESSPPTGPPLSRPSRAPPVFLLTA